MHCPKCGFNNLNGANFCSNCGVALSANPKPKPPRQNKNRKVVKLPSDHSADKPTRSERPWEVRVPQHQDAQSSDPATHRDRHAASTGRIPAIKRPRYESGKIPPEERPGAQQEAGTSAVPPAGARHAAQGGAIFGGAAAGARPSDTTPIVLDDYELSAPGTQATRSPYATRTQTPQRRSIRHEVEAYDNPDGIGARRKFLAVIIAILVICCLVAFGMFMAGSGDNARTIRFDTDGGTIIGNQYLEPESQLAKPANPTRPGYSFDGWYLDPDYAEEAEFPIIVTQDMTLYAKWTQERTSSDASTPATTPDESPTLPSMPADDGATRPSAGSTAGSGSGAGSGGTSSGATRPSGNSGASNAGASTGGTSSGNAGGTNGGADTGNAGNTPPTPAPDVNSNTASNGPVDITLVAANGTPLTGTVSLHDGYVIPDSSERAYTLDELRALGLNDAELCIARNEPYARQGYSFMNPGLQAYFNARSWYHNSGRRFELPADSAGYITAHNLLALAEQTPGAAQWLHLRLS